MNLPELLWKYAEGGCTAEEKTAVETQLAADPQLEEELRLIREIHSTLANLEPEEPSLRFTQNVMDSLPRIYTPAPIEPLVTPVWKQVFWGAVAVLFATILVLGKNTGTTTQQTLPYLDELNRGFSSIIKFIPVEFLHDLLPLLLVTFTLLMIDKVMVSRKLNIK